jgi:serine/threonine protein kinase
VMRARFPEPLPISMALRIAQHVAEGLAAVHAAGLIHRDVKPSNILLRADGTPVLTDLGLVAAISATAQAHRLTPADMILGTADYISPEQVAGSAVDGRSDLYSLGIVLYEMIVGFVPFAGRTPIEAARAHLEERPPPTPAATPQAVRALIDRALQKRPEDRFPSASNMAAAIAGLCASVDLETGAEEVPAGPAAGAGAGREVG